MQPTLYHYVHCPFCVRVRMTLSFLGIEYKSVVLPYDDEETPVKLTGKKMLPIMTINGQSMNESLDIMQTLDKNNALQVPQLRQDQHFSKLESILSEAGSLVHSLAMPFWIWTAEFNDSSRAYFKKKKEVKRGPFSELVRQQPKYVSEIQPVLLKIESALSPYYESETFRVNDILVAAHLWGLYSVPEFQFSDKLHSYLQSVKKQCHFNYQQPFLELT